MSGYTPDQVSTIQTIIQRLRRKGVPLGGRVAKAAIETPSVEANFTNPSGGDATSTGAYQQQNNGAWGAPNESVATDADQFIAAALRANKGFTGSAGALAQSVQRSAFPGRYDQKAGEASKLLQQYGGATPANVASYASSSPSVLGSTQDVSGSTPSVPNVIASYAKATAAPDPNQSALAKSSQGLASAVQNFITPQAKAVVAQNSAQPPMAIPGSTDNAPAIPVAKLVARANEIDQNKLPYLWGGGHGAAPARPNEPVDCSGAVSEVLGIDPRVAAEFKNWGSPGAGKGLTIYAKDTHVLMEINGHFFGTSNSNPGGGAGWIPRKNISPEYLKGYTVRHSNNIG